MERIVAETMNGSKYQRFDERQKTGMKNLKKEMGVTDKAIWSCWKSTIV